MKSLLALVLPLLYVFHYSAGQNMCCAPYRDYQAFITSYLGMTDLNRRNPFQPDAYVGKARRISSQSERMELTEFIDWNIPGFENTRYVIADARQQPATVYTVYRDGSCTSETIYNYFIAPPCVPPNWTYKETMALGDGRVVFERYGDDANSNYIVVQRQNQYCIPAMQLVTSKNQPNQGIYRFNTEYFYNVTQYYGTVPVPRTCRQGGGGGGGVTRGVGQPVPGRTPGRAPGPAPSLPTASFERPTAGRQPAGKTVTTARRRNQAGPVGVTTEPYRGGQKHVKPTPPFRGQPPPAGPTPAYPTQRAGGNPNNNRPFVTPQNLAAAGGG